MNERIKELYKKAYGVGLPVEDFVLDSNEKKFAELIIESCVNCIADDLNSMRDYTGKACRHMIKREFGVE